MVAHSVLTELQIQNEMVGAIFFGPGENCWNKFARIMSSFPNDPFS